MAGGLTRCINNSAVVRAMDMEDEPVGLELNHVHALTIMEDAGLELNHIELVPLNGPANSPAPSEAR